MTTTAGGSPRRTLAAIDRTVDAGEPITSHELAAELDCSPGEAAERLDRLVDWGALEHKRTDGADRLWWRPPAAPTPADPARRDDSRDGIDDLRREAGSGSAPAAGRRPLATGVSDDGTEVFFGADDPIVRSLLDNQRDIVYVIDADGTPRLWNDRFRDVTGYTDAEIEAASPAEFVPDDAVERVVDALERSLDGSVEVVEIPLWTADGDVVTYEFTSTPIRASDGTVLGVTGVGRDVSDRKATERRLERRRQELEHELSEVFDRIDDGFFAVDDDWRFTHVNAQAAALLDRTRDELLGERVWDAFPEAVGTTFQEQYREALATQESVSFEAFFEPLDTWFEVNAYPSESGLSVYFRDVTDRVDRQRELERYEKIVETIDDGIYVVDQEGVFTMVNEGYGSLLGRDPAALEGTSVTEVVDDESLIAEAKRLEAELAAGDRSTASIEAELSTAEGESWVGEATFSLIETDQGYERVGVVRDVTDRVDRERELERYETIVETIDDGVYALDDDGRFVLVNEAFCELTGYDREDLLGAPAATVHDETVSERVESMATAVRTGDREAARIELDIDTASGETVPCEARFGPLSLEEGHGRCGVVRDMTDRLAYERTLERQRNRLAALEDLHAVVRDVTDAVIDQSTRVEVEREVCDTLATVDAYESAWIGATGSTSESVRVRAEAGKSTAGSTAGGGSPATTATVDAAGRPGVDLARSALDSEESRVERSPAPGEATTDPGAAIAVPIVHDGLTFGALTVTTDRAAGFASDERAAVEHLGEMVGHAISSVERKRALMSEEAIELHYRTDVEELGLESSMAGTVTLDETVPLGDGRYLAYGTIEGADEAVIETLRERRPDWEAVTVREEGFDGTRFELELAEPPVQSTLSAQGGEVIDERITDEDCRLTVHLPPNADVGAVSEAVRDAYPGASLRSRTQVDRSGTGAAMDVAALADRLTDRQQTALEVSYRSGYFEWPRDATGEEVADALDVSPSTFHQHLRAAERKVLTSLFD
jgi:PAS domain S-box-containing protein